MTATTQIEDVRRKLTDAMKGIEVELAKFRSGQEAIDSEKNLKFCADGLQVMLSSLSQPNRPAAPDLGRIIVDTWPIDSELANIVGEAEYAYKRLK